MKIIQITDEANLKLDGLVFESKLNGNSKSKRIIASKIIVEYGN